MYGIYRVKLIFVFLANVFYEVEKDECMANLIQICQFDTDLKHFALCEVRMFNMQCIFQLVPLLQT